MTIENVLRKEFKPFQIDSIKHFGDTKKIFYLWILLNKIFDKKINNFF